jgi:hypothetical protein
MIDKYGRQQAFQNPETLATVVHTVIRNQYGEEAYGWDPLTVALEVKDDFGVDMDSAVLDRWSAVQVVMANNAFFTRLDAFLGICNTFAEGAPFFQVFDPVTVEEAAWGIVEVSLNRELLPFSYPIKQYLRTILKQDGYSETSYPAIFAEVFEATPDAIDIRKGLAALTNDTALNAYIADQLRDLVVQFNRIKDLQEVDNIILQRSLDEYVGTVVNKEHAS